MCRLRRRAARSTEAPQRRYPGHASSAGAGVGPSHRPSPHPEWAAAAVAAAAGRVITARRACTNLSVLAACTYVLAAMHPPPHFLLVESNKFTAPGVGGGPCSCVWTACSRCYGI
jgi:hypothetical protein